MHPKNPFAKDYDFDLLIEHYPHLKDFVFLNEYDKRTIKFGDKQADQIAMDALKKHYPGREIITLNADALGEVGGGIHCATQQMPI